jgi:hypothetical protein
MNTQIISKQIYSCMIRRFISLCFSIFTFLSFSILPYTHVLFFPSCPISLNFPFCVFVSVSYGTLRRVALVRTDISEELSASFIRVTRIGELRTTLAVTSNWHTLRRNTTFFAACLWVLTCSRFAKFPDSCHPDEGGASFLQSVGSYKNHTA